MLEVDRSRVLSYRARASHLDSRLSAGSLANAAYGGLQDSAPRAALISLHARVQGVTPDAWEDPSLCQIWGPRGADYVVARDALAVFTLGRMPRDREVAASLERTADEVHRFCQGTARRTRDVAAAHPEMGHSIRKAAITGRLLIRWDASSIWVIPVERPDADAEAARLELARRFLQWFAPATERAFAWWSGVSDEDARATWRSLLDEMSDVDLNGEIRSVFRSDEEELIAGARPSGVRLIPHGDPYIKLDGELVVPDPKRRPEIFPRPGVKTQFWPVAGAVVCDGEIVGSWARQKRRVTINPWSAFPDSVRDALEAEALSFPIPSRSGASVEWTR